MATFTNSKHSMVTPRKKLKDMSVDEFFVADSGSDSESTLKGSVKSYSTKVKTKNHLKINPVPLKSPTRQQSNTTSAITSSKSKETKFPHKRQKKMSPKETVLKLKKVKSRTKLNEQKSQLLSTKTNTSTSNGKSSMALTLKENDPEFYDFLKNQDKHLLDNLEELSQTEDEISENEVSDFDNTNNKKTSSADDRAFEKELLDMSSGEDSVDGEDSGIHQLPNKLEVASDDSDEDVDEEEISLNVGFKQKHTKGGILLKHRIIEEWKEKIQSKPTQFILREIISAFHAAVQQAEGKDQTTALKYKVEGGAVFNSVVRLCITQIVPALQTLLQLPILTELHEPISDKSASWKKLKVLVKSYITDLLELLTQLSEAAMVNVILKHVHKLVIFYATFPKLTRLFLKKMIKLWTTGEETTRVLAFLCINKIVRLKQEILLESCLKQMYMAYVSNCKFTSPSTLPLINFMQRSLVEIFTINQMAAYQYAFVYIRQLAIHLRNAISVKKKSTCQAVYNWQFIHCLGLWVQLQCSTYPNDILQPLIYPLTQTIIGTIKLLPSARYYPLRFQCVKLLNQLSFKTNTFIPIVPFLLEVFEQTDFNKRHKQVSLKPFNFAVILKFSKAQLHEKAYRDGLIDQLYELLLDSFNVQAHSIGFPELIIPAVLQLKDFLKKCKIANYCKQIKQIVDKIQEHSKFIIEKRKVSNMSLDDFQAVNLWETRLADLGTPLRKFHTSWRKLRDRELQHEIANKEAISGAAIDIPSVERKKPRKATPEEREDFSKLFENDSSEDETRFLLKEERSVKETKKRKREDSESCSDDYSDFDDEELELLAQSASSGEESEDADSCDSEREQAKKNSGNKIVKKENHGKKKVNLSDRENDVDEEDMVKEFTLSDYD